MTDLKTTDVKPGPDLAETHLTPHSTPYATEDEGTRLLKAFVAISDKDRRAWLIEQVERLGSIRTPMN